MANISKAFSQVNTIKFMNQVDMENMLLHILRVLHTDDGLTTTYMLLERSTIKDIVQMCEGIFNDLEDPTLNEEELKEFTDLINNLKVYTGDMR